MAQKSDIHTAYSPTGLVCPLFVALVDKKYDEVRQLTGHVNVSDNWQLLFKVGMEAGDPEFREKHGIDKKQARMVWIACLDEFSFYRLHDKRLKKLEEKLESFS